MDQCKFCTKRSNLEECQTEVCSFHESWIVKELQKKLREKDERINELKEANDELQDKIECILDHPHVKHSGIDQDF